MRKSSKAKIWTGVTLFAVICLALFYVILNYERKFDPEPEWGGRFFAGENGVVGHYTIRTPDNIRTADELALEGSQMMADEDFSGAIQNYWDALNTLPNWRSAESRRKAYRKQLWNALLRSIGL